MSVFWGYLLITCLIALPPLGVIWVIDRKKPKYYGHFLYGMIFIVYAVIIFKSLSTMNAAFVERFTKLKDLSKVDKDAYIDVKNTLDAWIYVIPAVIAAIGANLVTQFITSPKPQKLGGNDD